MDNFTRMLGAACGDIAGSVYEGSGYKQKPKSLYHPRCRFTDDTVMTCAVAQGLMEGLREVPTNRMGNPEAEAILSKKIVEAMRYYGRKYPYAGYGGSFIRWLRMDEPAPYGSWGNGSAMRASFAGWAAKSLAEAEWLGTLTAAVTHNDPQGITGAKVVAGCIYLLRDGGDKAALQAYAGQYYDLHFTLDEIRPHYKFDVSCQGSVPQAIKAFLEEEDFPSVIAAAISLGGDSDTIAAIAGSIAEVYYPMGEDLRQWVLSKLPDDLRQCLSLAAAWE